MNIVISILFCAFYTLVLYFAVVGIKYKLRVYREKKLRAKIRDNYGK